MPITQIKYQLLNRKKKKKNGVGILLTGTQDKCLEDDAENVTKGDGPA